MRLPGTINRKPEAGGHLVAVIADNPELRYSRAELIEAFPPVVKPPPRSSATDTPNGTRLPDDEWQRIGRAMLSIPPDSEYSEWLQIGQALHSTGDPRAFDRWDGWSKQADNYPGTDELRRKWSGFNAGGGVTLGTLFHIAKGRGYEGPTIALVFICTQK